MKVLIKQKIGNLLIIYHSHNFIKLLVDDDYPFYNVYGGTQDNNTQGGNPQEQTIFTELEIRIGLYC